MHPQLEQKIVEVVKGGAARVPPFPAAAMELMRLVKKDDYSQADLVKVVKSDQSFALTALRLANSPLFYRGHQVTELGRAVSCLGATELNRIAVSLTLRDTAFAQGPLVSLRRRAWREGVLSGHICQVLAVASKQDPEAAFTAGLLHDVGRLLALAAIEQVLQADPKAPALGENEWWNLVEQFRVELGLVLAVRWKLPEAIEKVIGDRDDDHEAAPLLRHVNVAKEVLSMMDSNPHLSELDLGQIAELSTDECQAVAKLLPEAVSALMAFDADPFGIDKGSKVVNDAPFADEADVAAVSVEDISKAAAAAPWKTEVETPTSTGDAVEVMGGSDQALQGSVLEAKIGQLTVRVNGPVRENLLVKVKWSGEPMQLCARVKSCEQGAGGATVHLLPFALSKQQNADWRAYVTARAA